jgi:peptide/nickel transport system permease protein
MVANAILLESALMLVATVLALNAFGDGVREALDPRARVRLEK